MLNVVCRRWSGIEWSTVSKAVDNSNIINAAESPRSTACSMSESTRRTAVSVEWPGRKPDCSDGRSRRMTGTASAGVKRGVPVDRD